MKRIYIPILSALLVLLLSPSPAAAQTYEVGPTVLFSEDDSFGWGNARISASLAGVPLPVLPTDAGVLVEAGYAGGGVVYSVWQTNRMAVPGCQNCITGVDLRLYRGGPAIDDTWDFDQRVVAGYRLTPNISAYAFFLEDGAAFKAVNVSYRF